MIKRPQQFQKLILTWFDQHGRKHLPWQENKTPYRVWVSEIMLQQTQVATVIPYFARFMQQFPDLPALAAAREDDVLHLWAGLGYYSRARNLLRAAKMVMAEFGGEFPANVADLIQLPGIGASTAGAIMSIAFNQRAPILDGNVKRVLARLHAITQPVSEKNTENELWLLAEKYTPTARVADYTQAMMDLGATLCVRGKPGCERCPLQKHCAGYAQGIAAQLPAKKAGRALPVKTATFLILQHAERILLNKRPATGIWGGLWSLPEIAGAPDAEAIRLYCRQKLRISAGTPQALTAFRHTFSHYHLEIHPVLIQVKRLPTIIMEAEQQIWYNPQQPEAIGLPQPVTKLMRELS